MQAAGDEQLGDARQRADDDERARSGGDSDLAGLAEQPAQRSRGGIAGRAGGGDMRRIAERKRVLRGVVAGRRGDAQARTWRRGEDGGHRNRGDGDHREWQRRVGTVGEQAAERGTDHRAHRGQDDRRADPARALSERGQPCRPGRPQDAEGESVGEPAGEQHGQRGNRLGQATDHEQHARGEGHPPDAEAVGEHPGRERDREHGQSREGEDERGLGARQAVVDRHPRQQRHDRRLGDAGHEEQRADERPEYGGGPRPGALRGEASDASRKHGHHLPDKIRSNFHLFHDCFCSL
jgi:hypothetical protein